MTLNLHPMKKMNCEDFPKAQPIGVRSLPNNYLDLELRQYIMIYSRNGTTLMFLNFKF